MNGVTSDWAQVLPGLLTTRRLGRTFKHLARCGSTSDEAARLADQGCGDGTVVTADQQTAGRGRLGRVWHSPAGANLYLSIVLRPPLPPSALPPLTLLTGVAVAETLRIIGIESRLKWPNDIMLPTAAGLRKTGGILTEMATTNGRTKHVIVGLGLNVLLTAFPPELADRATSLQLAAEAPPDRLTLLAQFLNEFEPLYDRFVVEGTSFVLQQWRRYGWLGQPCKVDREGATLAGHAVDVDETGALIIEDSAGKHHAVLSGEVVTPL
ncbi:MAG: biotin--[acetyl-CoA-carboxylase] ligase [Deltaproteobacteria bacterium]|nr:biotin--[acetyl-CoA-carboxylase] ligase [Deltaproteobacteria bacterium]